MSAGPSLHLQIAVREKHRIQNAESAPTALAKWIIVFVGNSVRMRKIKKESPVFANATANNVCKNDWAIRVLATLQRAGRLQGARFAQELQRHAAYVTIIGGERSYEKMNAIHQRSFQSPEKVDGFNDGFEKPQGKPEAIQELADVLSNAPV